jgi:hypothetical protein
LFLPLSLLAEANPVLGFAERGKTSLLGSSGVRGDVI